uniref:Uncharacterized protein n=1 Tax=Anopheles dirus TaxID=7168 RepID=A0A182N076_9DIPT
VECVAHIFDLYRHATVATADENYPQVRVLSNSDNGVHFSFMSDKDEASSSGSSSRAPAGSVPRTLLQLLGAATGGWMFRVVPHGHATAIADTGQTVGCGLLVGVALLRSLGVF